MNIFDLDDLSVEKIKELVKKAIVLKNQKTYELMNKKVANLFFEPSTRTHYSFISAQMNLGIKHTSLNVSNSSVKKGETLFDTAKTFELIGMDALIIRHTKDEYYKDLDKINIPIINAGDGVLNHPTQSLLDLMTIYEEFNKFEGLNVLIIGDVAHSRVAHTNNKIMKRLNMNVDLKDLKEDYNLDEIIKNYDVVMLLRVQHERHKSLISINDYNKHRGLNKDRIKLMRQGAIIMHPAPYNLDVEITKEAVEADNSRIYTQMTNGVFMRMALLMEVLK